MRRRVFMLIVLISIFSIPITTRALDIEKYINQNGVSISIDEYEKLVDIHSTNYVETLSDEEYKKIISNDLENVVVEEYE